MLPRTLLTLALALALSLALVSAASLSSDEALTASSVERAGHTGHGDGDHGDMSPEASPGHDHDDDHTGHDDDDHTGHDDDHDPTGHDHGDKSPEASPMAGSDSANGGDDDVCVDAALLAHLPARALVYAAHRQAGVLCDAAGSCATPGHMVVYAGRAMMMATYCAAEGVACSKRVMFVNSPRMGSGVRVGTKTGGLVFTPLAARYQTRAEEGVLKMLVHMGV